MEINLSKKHKIILCYIGIVMVFLLTGNSNNDPTSFMERLFRPINWGVVRFYYGNIFILVGMYFLFKQLYKFKNYKLLNTSLKRIFMLILTLILSSNIWVYFIGFYKSFFNDLNSIYLDRPSTDIKIEGNNSITRITGSIKLKNYSRKDQNFYIKFRVPNLAKEHLNIKEDFIKINKFYSLNNRELTIITFDEVVNETDINEANQSYFTSILYEFILYNDSSEVLFKGTTSEKAFLD